MFSVERRLGVRVGSASAIVNPPAQEMSINTVLSIIALRGNIGLHISGSTNLKQF
jgi:hypothetical protein